MPEAPVITIPRGVSGTDEKFQEVAKVRSGDAGADRLARAEARMKQQRERNGTAAGVLENRRQGLIARKAKRALMLMALPARLGRHATEPQDRDRRWTGWRARDVVIGETFAEKKRRQGRP